MIVSYLGIGTILFSLWEGWDLISATYFSFITATSIGFGDLVPLKAFSDTKSIAGQIRVIITSAYCIAGIFYTCYYNQNLIKKLKNLRIYILLFCKLLFKQKGLALVSMCLSLIQENISLYSSYFIKAEEEDTELDVVIPCDRIPNWIQISDSSDTDSVESITERSDTDESQSGIVEGILVGFLSREYDLRSINNILCSDVEEDSEDDNSFDHNKDGSSQERSEQEDSNSLISSSSSSIDSEDDVEDEDSSEDNQDEKDDNMK